MLYLIGYVTAGLIVGLLAWGLMVGDHQISLMQTSAWGIFGALFAGWMGLMLGWYEIGFGLGLLVATLGAVATVWVAASVFHRRHKHDRLAHR